MHQPSLTDSCLRPVCLGPRFHTVLGLTNTDNRWQQLMQLRRQFNVAVPHANPKVQQAQQKIKAKAKARAQTQPQLVKASSFKLQDGSPAQALSQLSPGSSGVVLLDPEEAAPHLCLRTVGELGVLILGAFLPTPSRMHGFIDGSCGQLVRGACVAESLHAPTQRPQTGCAVQKFS